MGFLESAVAGWAIKIVGGFIGGALLTWILNLIPKDKISTAFYGLGVAVTLGMAKWKFTKGFWNGKIEPFVIDLLENICASFISGLRSDNKGEIKLK